MKTLLIVLSIVLLSGCATDYQKDSYTGGFSSTQLGENMYQVSFRGNGFTSRRRAADFTLLRSAELTLDNGFRYFVIVGAEKSSNVATMTTPTTSFTTPTGYGGATTTTYGGRTFFVSKPNTTNTILCFKDKPKSGVVYNAKFVANALRQKYGLN
jgi:uncharacterized protein YceK